MARKKSGRPPTRFRGGTGDGPATPPPPPAASTDADTSPVRNEGSSPPAASGSEGSSTPNEGSSVADLQATIEQLTRDRDEARRLAELADHGLPVEAKNALCEFTAGHVTAYDMGLVLRIILEQHGIEMARQVAEYISSRDSRKAGQIRIKMQTIESLARVKEHEKGQGASRGAR